mmetsp:Transcript_16706/g.31288  ORF Transcript_16706/g.31288 Transcript_16706/m.31288 type:complete len:388 (-) Transcript_16706:902-2065(-)
MCVDLTPVTLPEIMFAPAAAESQNLNTELANCELLSSFPSYFSPGSTMHRGCAVTSSKYSFGSTSVTSNFGSAFSSAAMVSPALPPPQTTTLVLCSLLDLFALKMPSCLTRPIFCWSAMTLSRHGFRLSSTGSATESSISSISSVPALPSSSFAPASTTKLRIEGGNRSALDPLKNLTESALEPARTTRSFAPEILMSFAAALRSFSLVKKSTEASPTFKITAYRRKARARSLSFKQESTVSVRARLFSTLCMILAARSGFDTSSSTSVSSSGTMGAYFLPGRTDTVTDFVLGLGKSFFGTMTALLRYFVPDMPFSCFRRTLVDASSRKNSKSPLTRKSGIEPSPSSSSASLAKRTAASRSSERLSVVRTSRAMPSRSGSGLREGIL